MKKRINICISILITIICCIITFTATYSIAMTKFKYNNIPPELANDPDFIQKLKLVDEIVRNSYIGEIDEGYLADCIISGYINGINDKYAVYYSKDDMTAYLDSLNSNLIGIGVHITYDDTYKGIYITGIIPNSPALEQGLTLGDIITKVDDITIDSEETYADALSAIPGTPGDVRTIEVKRAPDYTKTDIIEIKIRQIVYDTVSYAPLDNNIALIRIDQFNSTTDSEFISAIDKALSDGKNKFIFDVRNNPGGYLNVVVNMLDRILPDGPIVDIVKPNDESEIMSSDSRSLNFPIAVLINNNSASASELFSSALRDYDMATLIGEKTYGKGTVQDIKLFTDGSGLKFSTSLYKPPYSENFEGVGIYPDIEVKLTEEQIKQFYKLTVDEDPQIQKAIEILANQ